MENKAEQFWEALVERHLPVGFLDYDVVMGIKRMIGGREKIGRKEALIMAYMIGADAEESNELLRLLNHLPLYAKRREDAIWRFMLNNRKDSTSIIDEIFPQNADEKSA